MSRVPKYSLYLEADAPENKNLIRLDDGLFQETIFTFENIRLIEENNNPELNYDTSFFKVTVNGVEIELSNNENMHIGSLIGDQLANQLYEEYISPILLDIIETQIRLEQLNG